MTGRRWYRVDTSQRTNPSDFELNEHEIYPVATLPDGFRWPLAAGHRTFRPRGSLHDISYGLPPLLATPRAKVAVKNKPADAYRFHTRLLISTRAKALLCSIDAEAFDFAECETTSRRGVSVEPYWLMDIARVVDDFDEASSDFDLASGEDGLTGEAFVGPHFAAVRKLRLNPDFPDDQHAFKLARFALWMVWSDRIVDAWQAAKLTGRSFIPLF